jgi:hypothetical protein
MATNTPAKGRQTNLFVGVESTYGIAPTDDAAWARLPYYSQTLKPNRPLEPDPILGKARHNNRDPDDPAPNLLTHGGDIVLPMDLGVLPIIGRLAFGAPTTTGTGSNLVHTFGSGVAEIPTFCAEMEVGTAKFRHHGLAVSRLAFAAKREAGYRRITTTILGQKMSLPVSLERPADLPDPSEEQIAAAIGIVKWNGTPIAQLMEASAQYDTGVTPMEYVNGTEEISGVELGNDAAYTGRLMMRFSDTTFYALAIAGTPGALSIEYTINSNRSLALSSPRVFLSQTGPEVSGPGGLEASFEFTAAQGSAADMLTMAVKTGAEAWPPAPLRT